MNKNILVVTTQSPYPTYHGGAFDVFEKLIGLKKIGFNIDLVVTTKNDIKEVDQKAMKKIVDNLFIVKRKNKLVDIFKLYPIQYTSRLKLKEIQFNRNYDNVILESEFLSSILQNKTLKYKRLFFRVHNDESYYFKQLAASTNNYFKKIYYWLDALKIKQVTNKLLIESDRIWYISKKEYDSSRYKNKSIFLPPPINEKFSLEPSDRKTVLFVGSLFMENNIQGLDWYLKHVHLEILKKYRDYKLIIAGSTGILDEKKIQKKYNSFEAIEIYLNEPSLDFLYKNSSIFINPMFFGSGVKLKSINAIVKGMLLISTDVGIEGIGINRKMYLNANSKEDFIAQICYAFDLDMTEKENIVKNAQNYLKSLNYINILKRELE